VTVNDPIYKHTDPDGDTLTIRTPGVGGRYQAVARDESGDPVCVYVTPEVLREAADAIEKHRREAKYLNAIRGIEALLRVVEAFDDDEEAIGLANDSDFGLYDYVYAGDAGRAYRVARQLRAGHVGINTAQRNHEAPFGGFKMSGVGRDNGDWGLYAYTEIQSIIWPG
jgi:hypothetical protein